MCKVKEGEHECRVRFLASIIGQYISMHAVFGETVR